MTSSMTRKTTRLLVILSLLATVSVSAQDRLSYLQFSEPPASESDAARTLESLVKVQGSGGLYQDGLYLITHYGDRDSLFKAENQKTIDNPWVFDTWRYCSVFSKRTNETVIMGRNWDNQNVGSIIVSLYLPPDGYPSISFCRAIDMGFPLNLDLEEIKSSDLGSKLLLAPFYATDGINEKGLTVAVAGVRQTQHQTVGDRKLVFVTFLVRKLLDGARNVDEAVELVENFVPFDLDKNCLNTHFYIADSSGRSVVLEYAGDEWRKIYTDKSWQVLTNKSIFEVLEADLREKCWRYKGISESLEAVARIDWKDGMRILRDSSQQGTTWSVVYAPTSAELFFSVYQKWEKVYHLEFP